MGKKVYGAEVLGGSNGRSYTRICIDIPTVICHSRKEKECELNH